MHDSPALPDPLPSDPMPLFQAWFDEAVTARNQPNPDCFTLCTSTAAGRPSGRMVLCKRIEAAEPGIVFFTNYGSRKGDQLASNPHGAAVFHWDHFDRQVRIEGSVARVSEAESDAYFASRKLLSRLGAWASNQSRPIASHADLFERVGDIMVRFKIPPDAVLGEGPEIAIPRPAHWGGFRISIERLELWQGADARLHDRAVWEYRGAWQVPTRLQP